MPASCEVDPSACLWAKGCGVLELIPTVVGKFSTWICTAGLEMGIRKPIEVRPQAMLEAKDLPTCELSDFIEERLRSTLAEDRALRAKKANCMPHQVSILLGFPCKASAIPICM